MSNEEVLKTIRGKIEEHEERISKLEALSQKKPELITKKLSIKEFILSKKPQDDIQKTLAIGRYLERYEGFSSFNVPDLDKGFRDAKEPVPQNINDKANKNIAKGHMMEAKEKKDNITAWVLTNSGEEYVDSGFQEKK